MTIQASTARLSFPCNGVSNVFPVNIQAYLPNDFLVLLTNTATGLSTVLVLNGDYTLVPSGSLTPTFWTLTTQTGQVVSPYVTGNTLQVILNPSEVQLSQYTQGQAFPSLAVQTSFDRNVQMAIRQSDILSRTITAPDGDVSPVMALPIAAIRKNALLTFDSNGNIAVTLTLPPGTTLSTAVLAPFLNLQQAQAEFNNGVTPVAQQYPFGDLRRYGATGGLNGSIPSVDDSAAWASACKVGTVIIPKFMAFKILTGAITTAPVTVIGSGRTSEIYCDSTGGGTGTLANALILGTGATGSTLKNFYIANITAPLTIIRAIETTVQTTATLTLGNAVIAVASASGLRQGMEVTGYGIAAGSVIQSIASLNVTLSDPVVQNASGQTYNFYDITFNSDAAAYATRAQNSSVGRHIPTVNDTGVWSLLTALEKQQAQVGPVISLTGDDILVEDIFYQHLSILLMGTRQRASRVRGFGGWTWGAVAFLNFANSANDWSCVASNCSTDDHGFGGIVAYGYSSVSYQSNIGKRCGESTFKIGPFTTVASGGFLGCKTIVSSNNVSIAGYQGSHDYNAPFAPTASPAARACSSKGDVGMWGPFGALGYSGSGWIIEASAYFNPGPGIIANVDHSDIRLISIENAYANLNAGVTSTNVIQGANNTTSARIANKTTRARTGFSLVYSGGSSALRASSSSLVNTDLSDAVTADANTLQLTNVVDQLNVKGNGPLSDCSVGSEATISITPAATVAIDLSVGRRFNMFLGSAIAVQFLNPVNIPLGYTCITIFVQNASGAPFTPTFDTLYKLTGAGWGAQASATVRLMVFQWNGTHWHLKSNSGDVIP